MRDGAPPNDQRNEQATLYAKVSDNGELEITVKLVNRIVFRSILSATWDPSLYFPEQTQAKLDAKSNSLFSA